MSASLRTKPIALQQKRLPAILWTIISLSISALDFVISGSKAKVKFMKIIYPPTKEGMAEMFKDLENGEPLDSELADDKDEDIIETAKREIGEAIREQETAGTEEDFRKALDKERDRSRLLRLLKMAQSGYGVAKVILHHDYGLGDKCYCTRCYQS